MRVATSPMPETAESRWIPSSENDRYVTSCRLARWRSKCHVRRRPPLSSGSSRSDLSHRIFTRTSQTQHLDPFFVDERTEPELEVEQAPDAVGAVHAAGRVIAEQAFDATWIDNAALT